MQKSQDTKTKTGNIIVILHGWQSAKEKWQKVKEATEEQGLRVIVPDIPGFKPETSLKNPWTLNDYLLWFDDFLKREEKDLPDLSNCLLYTSPSPRDGLLSRMPSSA